MGQTNPIWRKQPGGDWVLSPLRRFRIGDMYRCGSLVGKVDDLILDVKTGLYQALVDVSHGG